MSGADGALTAAVVCSAYLHALWNSRLKRLAQTEGAAVAALAAAALWALVAALARLALGGPAPFPSAAAVGWSLAAGLGEAAYFLLLALALKRGPLGPVYTLARGGALFAIWPLSIWLLGEQPSPRALAGTALILLGLPLAGGGAAGAGRALWPAVTAAGAIAGYHLAYKFALRAGGEPAAVFALSMLFAVPLNQWALARRGHGGALARLWRESAGTLALTGGICALSFLLLLWALAAGGAGWTVTLRNLSIVFALLLARAQGERAAPRQWAGAGLAVAGALLMG